MDTSTSPERYRYEQPGRPDRWCVLQMPVGLGPPPTLVADIVPGVSTLLVYVGDDRPHLGLPRWYLAGSWIYWRHRPSDADYCPCT